MVLQVDGRTVSAVEVNNRPDLAGLRAQTAPSGLGHAVHIEKSSMPSASIVTSPNAPSFCAWTRSRRPGPGPLTARAADDARHARAAHPRLRPQRNHQPFAAFDIIDGTAISELHRQHRATEFKKFLATVDKTVPVELDVHLICDNYGTHKTPAVRA
ncbi:hypothetical protein AB0B20_22635 [Micromonospora sp. NPDC049151]|uniref:hypothetical protein n=1 Tax=Micromonospora sp. NPDC049151 TaxID=3155648 RepID=UPI00340789C0